MVILHVIVNLAPGGAELMLKRLIAAHAGHPGYTHQVISLREMATVGPQLERLGVQVEALGLSGALGLPHTAWRLTARIGAIKPDIVQTWMYHADLLGGLAARLAGRRQVIWSVRATHIPAGQGTSPLTSLIRRACALLSSAIPQRIVYVANSARAVHEELGYDPSKSVVISNGYEVPSFIADDATRLRLRQQLGLAPDALLVGTAGRFNALKDYRTFIAAAAMLASHNSKAHFLMLGRGLERSNKELEQWVKTSGYGGRFHMLGEQADLTEYLAGLDIFCLHSISEGFPNVVAEAMALGVPCVVTDVGDAAFLVDDTGLVVPPAKQEALAEALSRLAAEGKEARAVRGLRARERIAARFSLQAIAARYEELYSGLYGTTDLGTRP